MNPHNNDNSLIREGTVRCRTKNYGSFAEVFEAGKSIDFAYLWHFFHIYEKPCRCHQYSVLLGQEETHPGSKKIRLESEEKHLHHFFIVFVIKCKCTAENGKNWVSILNVLENQCRTMEGLEMICMIFNDIYLGYMGV